MFWQELYVNYTLMMHEPYLFCDSAEFWKFSRNCLASYT